MARRRGRKSSGISSGKAKTWAKRIAALAAGAAVASLPLLSSKKVYKDITVAAVVGGAILLGVGIKSNNELVKFFGLGLVMGGGVGKAADKLLAAPVAKLASMTSAVGG